MALALAGLAVLVGPGLVLLDAGEEIRGPRIESRHDPGTCSVVHDHAACAQLSHSLALPTDGIAGAPARATVQPPRPRPAGFGGAVRLPSFHRPRAPPSPPA